MPRWASTWMKKSNESSGEKQKGVQEKKTPRTPKENQQPQKGKPQPLLSRLTNYLVRNRYGWMKEGKEEGIF